MADAGGDTRGVEKVYLNMSIDDFIKVGHGTSKLDMSLEEVIRSQKKEKPKYKVTVKGTLGARNTQGQMREYKDDVFKSLDSVIYDRGILGAPSYKSRDRDDDLPLTGRNARLLSEGNMSRSSSSSSLCLGATAADTARNLLDPMTTSLDDIIVDRRVSGKEGRVGREIYEQRKRNRGEFEMKGDEVRTDSGKRTRFSPKLTPYKAVTFLAESFMIIEIKLGKKVEFTEENTPQKWRCVIKCGDVQGITDSTRKVVAREIACQEFLTKLKEKYPDVKIPEYEVPTELFLDPKVIDTVEKLGVENCADVTFEMCVENRNGGTDNGPYIYKCLYYMGSCEFFGRSPEKQYAQLKAAGKVYQALSGETFPLTKYFTGEDCDPNVEYDFNESEVYQTITAATKTITTE